jgi:hypothetical protein
MGAQVGRFFLDWGRLGIERQHLGCTTGTEENYQLRRDELWRLHAETY